MDPEPDADQATPGSKPEPTDEPTGEYANAAFTFEGQIERLRHLVVGINRRGGRQKRIAQVLVVGGLVLLAAFYLAMIFWGIVG